MQRLTSLTLTEPAFSIDVSLNDFNLGHTLGSAQCFTWKQLPLDSDEFSAWTGFIKNKKVTVLQRPEVLEVFTDLPKSDVEYFFSLDSQDFAFQDVLKSLVIESEHDETLLSAIQMFSGLRLLRQDVWETIACFISSQNSNVDMIGQRVNLLCEKFGEKIQSGYLFPLPSAIANASLDDLNACKMGYRSSYLKDSASMIASGEFSLVELQKMDFQSARAYLLTLPGVGPKVADCICLFSLNHLSAFPVDTHVFQILNDFYEVELRHLQGNRKNLRYEDVVLFANKKFGNYCGYAQQYLFHLHRVAKSNFVK